MNIIAYGSLMNKNSLEKTLGRHATLKKIIVPNVKRFFNAPFGDYAFLNLLPDKKNFIEAAYFCLSRDELGRFSEREAGSTLQELLPGFFAFIWPDANCRELPVLQSYITFCSEGALQNKISFWQGTYQPHLVINDLNNPLYF